MAQHASINETARTSADRRQICHDVQACDHRLGAEVSKDELRA
jgi:hypothetical protein